MAKEIESKFGFKPQFEKAKHNLEKNDGAGNTFKATAKPVLIGTAVVGATTMIFGIILMLNNTIAPGQVVKMLSLVQPEIVLGFLMGGAVIYWFTGASCQAVVTGAYRAVVYIKENMDLSAKTGLDIEDSKEVVKICTHLRPERHDQHLRGDLLPLAGAGVLQLLLLHRLSDQHRLFRPVPGHLHGQCRRRLGQRQEDRRSGPSPEGDRPPCRHRRGRHRGRSVQGHLLRGDEPDHQVHDPVRPAGHRDRRRHAAKNPQLKLGIAVVLFLVALVFIYRSFFGMRIPDEERKPNGAAPKRAQPELAARH